MTQTLSSSPLHLPHQHSQKSSQEQTDLELTEQSQEWIVDAFDVPQVAVPFDKHVLGRISKHQLTHGVSVLTHLLKILSAEHPNKADIIKFTNELYTVIPHSSGMKPLPLLDNIEMVKHKIQTLEDLLQVY